MSLTGRAVYVPFNDGRVSSNSLAAYKRNDAVLPDVIHSYQVRQSE